MENSHFWRSPRKLQFVQLLTKLHYHVMRLGSASAREMIPTMPVVRRGDQLFTFSEIRDEIKMMTKSKDIDDIAAAVEFFSNCEIVVANMREALLSIQLKVINEHDTAIIELEELSKKKQKDGLEDFVVALISRLEEDFRSRIEGSAVRIQHVLNHYVKHLQDIDIYSVISDVEIKNATFDEWAKKMISPFLAPSISCADCVVDILQEIGNNICSIELKRYPHIRALVHHILEDYVQEETKTLKDFVHTKFEMEMGYINTFHPSFITRKEAEEITQEPTEATKLMLLSYNQIFQTSLQDSIQKACISTFKKAKSRLHGHLIVQLLSIRSDVILSDVHERINLLKKMFKIVQRLLKFV